MRLLSAQSQTQALLRIMVQLEASGYICAESSCISEVFPNLLPFPSCRSSEFEVAQPFFMCGAGLFPAGLGSSGIKLCAMHTLEVSGNFRSLGVLTKLLSSCPPASPALKQRVMSGFKALPIPSPHLYSYGCRGSG